MTTDYSRDKTAWLKRMKELWRACPLDECDREEFISEFSVWVRRYEDDFDDCD